MNFELCDLSHLSLRGVAGVGKPDTQLFTTATTSNLPLILLPC